MNQQQVMGLIRQVLPLAGGILTTIGWLSPEQMESVSMKVIELSGPMLVLTSMAWSMVSKTNKAIVASAIALPEVKRIECASTPAGAKLADSVPDPNVTTATLGYVSPEDERLSRLERPR